MTVYESLANWLNEIFADPASGFSGEFAIDAEGVPNWQGVQNAALFSSPNDTAAQLLGGQIRHTAYKALYVRQGFKGQEARIQNEAFFESLRKQIAKRALAGDMPKDGRKWRGISVNGGYYPFLRAENGDAAIYQVPLKIVYEE